MDSSDHFSIDNIKLSKDLQNLNTIGQQNMERYIEAKMKKAPIKLTIVQVTKEEEIENDKIENKTLNEIKILAFERINTLSSEQQTLYEEMFIKNIKGKPKSTLIDFYYQLCEIEDDTKEKE